jgi:Ca2+-binding RTX toxin-like protein
MLGLTDALRKAPMPTSGARGGLPVVKFVAKTIAVDNSSLTELDNFKPFNPPLVPNVGFESKYKNGKLSVKVTENDAFKYKISAIEVARKDVNKLFKGDNWEPNLFKGDDTINGSSEGDALYGYNGADVISGKSGDDTIYGGKGKDSLYGGDGVDTIFGGKGNDLLDGGSGSVNSLTGGAGKDTFSFTAEVAAGVSYSQIEDFVVGKDKIQLAKSAFEGIGAKGTLKAAHFFLLDDYDGSAGSVIYDQSNGNMHYAKDAGGTALDAPIFGRIANGAVLSNTDFLVA